MTHLKALLAAFVLLSGPAALAQGADGGVLRTTLPNGLQVVIVPNRLAPVVTTELNYLAGSNEGPPGFPGTAHALEHMLFRGAAGLDKDQFAELGGLLGGAYNASTTETVTKYNFTVPASDLDVVLRIEAGRMRGATISEADWRQERGAINQEVSRNLSNPFWAYSIDAQALLFGGTPYENTALGTRPSFELTDAALLRRFYDAWYAPNNAILVIAGDVDPPAALRQVEQTLGAVPARPLPPRTAVAVAPMQARTIERPTNFAVGLVAISFRMPGLKSRDFAAADILSDVLNSRRGALYGLVPAGRTLQAQFSFQPKADVGVGLAYLAYPRGADPQPVLADARRVLAELREGVDPALVDAAKRGNLAQLAFEADSISGLAGSWSRAATNWGGTPADLARAYEAVTVADVNRLARELLDPDLALTAILSPSGPAVPSAPPPAATESFASPPDQPVTLPGWAASMMADLPNPGPSPAPDVTTLPNGLRLIVLPSTISPTVSVWGRTRNVSDVQEPAGKEGIASLMSGLFSYGTEARDRIAFQAALDDLAAQHRAGPDFRLQVLAPQFAAGMALLAEGQLRPAFPEQAFTVAQRQLAQSLAGLPDSPDYKVDRALESALFPPSDPQLREATPESVNSITRADLLAYYKQTMRPDLTTIVVAGDVTPAEARRVVAEAFSAWEAPGPTPAIDLPPAPLNPSSAARVPDTSSVQDRVTLSATLAIPVTSPDRYALLLGNTVLGGGFSSRLYRDLRVRTGYVYSVSSSLDWSRTRARHTISFGADAGNVDRARTAALQNIRAMQDTPLTPGELTRAKAQILRSLAMQRSSLGAIAGGYLRFAELGLPLDTFDTAARRYREMDAGDVQRAFQQWLRPDGFVQVVKGPPLQQ